MNQQIRVLVVEDSDTAAELIIAILSNDPMIQVVGRARDGVEGIEMASELRPTVITMDINMPRLNGYEATMKIMETTPTPIVVVTSNKLLENVHEGLDILLAGALEIVQKPSTTSCYQSISQELISKVKAVSQINFFVS